MSAELTVQLELGPGPGVPEQHPAEATTGQRRPSPTGSDAGRRSWSPTAGVRCPAMTPPSASSHNVRAGLIRKITVRKKSARPWKTMPSGGSQRERFMQVQRHRHALAWGPKRSSNPSAVSSNHTGRATLSQSVPVFCRPLDPERPLGVRHRPDGHRRHQHLACSLVSGTSLSPNDLR
jgi:hypothetical protein